MNTGDCPRCGHQFAEDELALMAVNVRRAQQPTGPAHEARICHLSGAAAGVVIQVHCGMSELATAARAIAVAVDILEGARPSEPSGEA